MPRILYIDDSSYDRELVADALGSPEAEGVTDGADTPSGTDLAGAAGEGEAGVRTGRGRAPEPFELVSCRTREQLIEHLRRETFDLVLTDFNIAGLNGLEVIDLVLAINPELPIVVVTGTGSEQIAVEALKRGASDYVIKSVSHIQRLPTTLRTVLHHRSVARERRSLFEAYRRTQMAIDHCGDGVLIVESSTDDSREHDARPIASNERQTQGQRDDEPRLDREPDSGSEFGAESSSTSGSAAGSGSSSASRLVSVNPAAAAIVGRRPEELIERSLTAFCGQLGVTRVSVEGRGESAGRDLWALLGPEAAQGEILCEGAGGERRTLHWRADPVAPGETSPGTWVLVLRDVTELRQAEAELRFKEEQLRRATRLISAGEIASTLAHEINQPLASIRQYAETLEAVVHEQRSFDPARVCEAATGIVRQSDRATEVIQRLRTYLRKQSPRVETVDIARLVWETEQLLGPALNRRGVRLDLHRVRPREVRVDPVQIQQVLVNLIMNAAEAIEAAEDSAAKDSAAKDSAAKDSAAEDSVAEDSAAESSVGVRSSGMAPVGGASDPGADPSGAAGRTIRLRTDPDPRRAGRTRVCVTDPGPGVGPEALDQLFDAFYSTKPQGLGLGLSICRSIVEGHGGQLWIDSGRPGACTFCFTLADAPPRETDSPARDVAALSGRARA